MFSGVQTYLANTIKVTMSRALLSLAKVGILELSDVERAATPESKEEGQPACRAGCVASLAL